jgi:hypothetical protein
MPERPGRLVQERGSGGGSPDRDGAARKKLRECVHSGVVGAFLRSVWGIDGGKSLNSYISTIDVFPMFEGKGTRVQEYGAGGAPKVARATLRAGESCMNGSLMIEQAVVWSLHTKDAGCAGDGATRNGLPVSTPASGLRPPACRAIWTQTPQSSISSRFSSDPPGTPFGCLIPVWRTVRMPVLRRLPRPPDKPVHVVGPGVFQRPSALSPLRVSRLRQKVSNEYSARQYGRD